MIATRKETKIELVAIAKQANLSFLTNSVPWCSLSRSVTTLKLRLRSENCGIDFEGLFDYWLLNILLILRDVLLNFSSFAASRASAFAPLARVNVRQFVTIMKLIRKTTKFFCLQAIHYQIKTTLISINLLPLWRLSKTQSGHVKNIFFSSLFSSSIKIK